MHGSKKCYKILFEITLVFLKSYTKLFKRNRNIDNAKAKSSKRSSMDSDYHSLSICVRSISMNLLVSVKESFKQLVSIYNIWCRKFCSLFCVVSLFLSFSLRLCAQNFWIKFWTIRFFTFRNILIRSLT